MGGTLALFLFSLAGMAPLAGFFGKYFLFKLAMDQGQVGLIVVAVLNSFLSAFYYLRAAVVLYQKPGVKLEILSVPTSVGVALLVCSLGTLILGFLKFSF
jgi:NADH-quinone oxidoreductase subunit N